MKVPIQIVFRNMERSDLIETQILDKTEKLDKVYDRITSCRVTVEIPHKHHSKGNEHGVTIDIAVPEKKIVVNRTASGSNGSSEVALIAFKDALEAAKRQLEDYARKRRGHVKLHEQPQPAARITQLFSNDGYGFLETIDGREIYFHSNSVVNDKFDRLEVGTEVTYVEQLGVDGPQASTVKVKA
ncbi:MAG: HPF/RaiA family ribosome-associated protein [Candidatus Obscuribacterales bacterium]|nr:HPF/RaiA family ribosome-associated protein [Candidatus Obscuribacterales bacterium]